MRLAVVSTALAGTRKSRSASIEPLPRRLGSALLRPFAMERLLAKSHTVPQTRCRRARHARVVGGAVHLDYASKEIPNAFAIRSSSFGGKP